MKCSIVCIIFICFLGNLFAQANSFEQNKDQLGASSTPAPEAFWTFSIDEETPGRVIFNDLSLYHPNQWQWHFGDGIGSSFDDPTHLYERNGNFLACLTVSNSAGSDTACDTIQLDNIPSSIYGRDVFPEVNFYPNPAKNWLKLSDIDKRIQAASLYNLSGQLMSYFTTIELASSIDISNLPSGIYILVLHYPTVNTSSKFVKE